MHDPKEKELEALKAAEAASKRIPKVEDVVEPLEIRIGQIFTLNNRMFRVRKITNKDVVLRPVIGGLGRIGDRS